MASLSVQLEGGFFIFLPSDRFGTIFSIRLIVKINEAIPLTKAVKNKSLSWSLTPLRGSPADFIPAEKATSLLLAKCCR